MKPKVGLNCHIDISLCQYRLKRVIDSTLCPLLLSNARPKLISRLLFFSEMYKAYFSEVKQSLVPENLFYKIFLLFVKISCY